MKKHKIDQRHETTKKQDYTGMSRGFASMRAVRSLVRLGRQRSRGGGGSGDEEEKILKEAEQVEQQQPARDPGRPPSACSTLSDNESTYSLSNNVRVKKHKSETVNSTPLELKAQDFQV
nr:uncharacterized protein LOC128703673 [Cherax quadricarinatus]